MPVTVIVGGQFGGEGKGKVAHFLAQKMNSRIAIRVGGTNSGHTVIDPSGNPIILRQLPTPSILPSVTCVLGAGSYINPEILFREIELTQLSSDRLFIDPNAMVITEQDITQEQNSNLRNSIGSTLSGTGAAVRRRIIRDSTTKLANDDDRLQQFVKPVIPFLRDMLSSKERIIIEGTQGFGLSVLHSPYYPFTTSRETTAAAFVSEVGLSPLDVDDVVLTIRAFPIRVEGNSGPLADEIDWETVTAEGKHPKLILERTSVSNQVRRVARFTPSIVRQAIQVNRPTKIVLNHLDYLGVACEPVQEERITAFVDSVEKSIGTHISILGFGPRDLRIRKSWPASVEKIYG